MTDHERRVIADIRLQIDYLVAQDEASRPAGNGTGRADLHTFASLAAATVYLAECERYEPGQWEIGEQATVYVVQRKRQ